MGLRRYTYRTVLRSEAFRGEVRILDETLSVVQLCPVEYGQELSMEKVLMSLVIGKREEICEELTVIRQRRPMYAPTSL